MSSLNAGDNVGYAKAFYELEIRKINLAVALEDLIFDYFGIIAIQYELSNAKAGKDAQFHIDKMQRHAEIANKHMKKETPKGELTLEKAKEYGQKISKFTIQLM